MSEKRKIPNFEVGPKGKREVKKLLTRSTNPAATITSFQTSKSLRSMFAKAFDTNPSYEEKKTRNSNATTSLETLDTDSVLSFLGHLGVSRQEVHKRIADSIQKQLEEEIRKAEIPKSESAYQGPLVNLLKNCWHHATTVPEFRPILWAVLKKLGEQTPQQVLNALAERDPAGTSRLRHNEVFQPLPPLLKRLVWEADWDAIIPANKELAVKDPKEYLHLVKSTLFNATVQPIVDKYCLSEALVQVAGKFFVISVAERRFATNQRRALAYTATGKPPTSTTSLLGKGTSTNNQRSVVASTYAESGKAVSQLRSLLGETTGGTAAYRPKLLHALLTMLMAHHGEVASQNLTGTHLHCTLLADVLLSAGGPLPKIYTHVHKLTQVLDDAVKSGDFSDEVLVAVQSTLKEIHDAEAAESNEVEKAEEASGEDEKAASKETKAEALDKPNPFLQRQLDRIITAGIQAMKETDPQNLFLNPVTDIIAPGYSQVIKKPMCISTMENKIDAKAYNSIEDWNSDVKLMFKNCLDYNRGAAGQWFRGEAGRQMKIFKDEILPQAKKLYDVEVKKRNPEEELKRKREEDKDEKKILPLPASAKKRKISKDNELTLSMPALASMLLADPFVVRLLLSRLLRSVRIDVLQNGSIPASHESIPSLLQLLHLANFSTRMCAVRGRRYLVPDVGLKAPRSIGALEDTVPFDSLRRYLPTLMQLSLEIEIDKRVVSGGDLHQISESITRSSAPSISLAKDAPQYRVVVALLEGLFVNACVPGNSLDTSLNASFTKFSSLLQQLSGSVWNERAFFVCLVPVLLRYKTRLNLKVRDTIISTWTSWLTRPEVEDNETAEQKTTAGPMTSAGHEYFILLLNEWASISNLLMPRDLLSKVTIELIGNIDKTEHASEMKFSHLWMHDDPSFSPIKKQYERMLGLLSENQRNPWKVSTGLWREEEHPPVSPEVGA